MSAATQATSKMRLIDIIAGRPDIRIIGIDRKGVAVVIPLTLADQNVFLEYDVNWKAWTARLPKGKYQQICVFEPQAEEA